METRVLCVTATDTEAGAIRKIAVRQPEGFYVAGNHRLDILVAGVGSVPVMWNMCKWISANGKPDIAVNAGIAGSFLRSLSAGKIVVPEEDCFADAGVDDNGKFLTLAEAGLADPREFPFVDSFIPADSEMLQKIGDFSRVRAVTVNTVSGSAASISRIVEKFNPGIETMEGAAFFYICRCESIPFFSLRAISNMIEPRNRENWNIGLALDNLSASLEQVFYRI